MNVPQQPMTNLRMREPPEPVSQIDSNSDEVCKKALRQIFPVSLDFVNDLPRQSPRDAQK